MDIVEASGSFMDRNIVGSQVEVVSIGESQQDDRATSTVSADRSFVRIAMSASARFDLHGGVEMRRMISRYFTLTAELRAVRWGICQSIWPLELILMTACVSVLWRFTPAIAPTVPALENARNTIVALGVAWPLLRECVTCLQLHRLEIN